MTTCSCEEPPRGSWLCPQQLQASRSSSPSSLPAQWTWIFSAAFLSPCLGPPPSVRPSYKSFPVWRRRRRRQGGPFLSMLPCRCPAVGTQLKCSCPCVVWQCGVQPGLGAVGCLAQLWAGTALAAGWVGCGGKGREMLPWGSWSIPCFSPGLLHGPPMAPPCSQELVWSQDVALGLVVPHPRGGWWVKLCMELASCCCCAGELQQPPEATGRAGSPCRDGFSCSVSQPGLISVRGCDGQALGIS